MGEKYDIFGTDPSKTRLPRKAMECADFDEFTQNRFLILPNLAFTLLEDTQMKESLRKASIHYVGNDWKIFGTVGDFRDQKSMARKLTNRIGTNVLIATQSRITFNKLSSIRKDVCGYNLSLK